MAAVGAYPVRVDASLGSPLSRWLWLVKWVLLIPHYVILAFLWLAFVVLSMAAFFWILFTGTYPRPVFEFNVGVLRWTWRVQYYAIGAFATDRYPPFTLAEDPAYPAHLAIDYPGRMSRGLVLVKWWLLAIPHYLIVALFTGSGLWLGWQYGNGKLNFGGMGLIGILALIAALALLVSGRYPAQIYDFVMGMNRWVLRVAAYAGLMTDRYPPFRLDMGGPDPGGMLTGPAAAPGAGPAPATPGDGPAAPHQGGWTTARIVSAVIGAVLVLCSLGLLGAGGVATWGDTARRSGGYVDLGTQSYRTGGYALASGTVDFHARSSGWNVLNDVLGKIRLQVTSTAGHGPVFVGIATTAAADRYLAGVSYATVKGPSGHSGTYLSHAGGVPSVPPARAGIWTASVTGPGTQTLYWQPANGAWTVIAMNADASHPVVADVNVSATLPALGWIAAGLLIAGVVALAGGILLIVIPARRTAS